MLKITFAALLLCLGIAGYTYATDGIDGKTPSVEQEAQEIQFSIPVWTPGSSKTQWFTGSSYAKNRWILNASILMNEMTEALCPSSEHGFMIRLLRFPLETFLRDQLMISAWQYFDFDESQWAVLDRLIMLQQFKYRKLNWKLLGLIYRASRCFIYGTLAGGVIHTVNPMLWYTLYAGFYNYIWRGKSATMLPHRGELYYMLCIRPFSIQQARVRGLQTFLDPKQEFVDGYELKGFSLDTYFGCGDKGDKTLLVSLSNYGKKGDSDAQGSLFFRTDRLLAFRGHTVDVEAGVGWDGAGSKKKWLVGLQGKFRFHEYFSLDVGIACKTPGFREGITASGDGWSVNFGGVVHLGG